MTSESNSGDETVSADEFAYDLPVGGDEPSDRETKPIPESALTVSREEFDGLQEKYLRLAAEYENFRRRTERERAELRDRSQGQLVARFLDVLDDLDRLSEFTPEGTTVEALLEGVRLIDRKLAHVLEAAGLEAVPVEGERFDPTHHEALMLTPTEDPAEDEMVGNVFQSGYRFKGTLLRPARVQVKRLDD
jgi:molecular chaperone GrpE